MSTASSQNVIRDEESLNIIAVKRGEWRSITYNFMYPNTTDTYNFIVGPVKETGIPDGCINNSYDIVHIIKDASTCQNEDRSQRKEFHVLLIHGNSAVDGITIMCRYRINQNLTTEPCRNDTNFMVIVEEGNYYRSTSSNEASTALTYNNIGYNSFF